MIHYTVRDRVALITIDNPPVNALSGGVPEAIEEAVDRAANNPEIDAVVLIGAGSTFVAGADINIFRTLATVEQSIARSRAVHARLRRIEDCPKPVVAAIHGFALGGGMELAMACHYRVARAGARVGQPEVTLGIIPGAGGTQRLPRLCGPDLALEMCTKGDHLIAERAHQAGIIDAVFAEDLQEAAVAFALEAARGRRIRKTRELNDRIADDAGGVAACQRTREALRRDVRGVRAPFAAVDAIEAGLTSGFDEGSEREMELFAESVLSTESRALVHLFFAEREAVRATGAAKDAPAAEVARAAVIGAGTMGAGIAMVYANAGIPVLINDANQEALDRGMATIRRVYESSASRGRIGPDEAARRLTLITPTLTYDGFDAADVVTEAAFEDPAVKETIFRDLGQVTGPACILASNTSTLDIDRFAVASGRPERVLGHHFFSPAHIMRLLEIVKGRDTAPDVIATSMKLAKQLGKVPVLVGNCFGFVANRTLACYRREALLLLEEGATVVQIDKALTDFGMPMGPFAAQDVAGLDIDARVRQYLRSIGKTRAEGPQSEVPDRLFEMGRLGQKTGAGWYRYEPGSRTPIPDPLVDAIASAEAAKRGVTRRTVTDEEIVDRMVTAVINEGANILDEAVAARAGDIDVIHVYGFGFPRYRGGPMFYGDTIGLPVLLERLETYRAQFGDYWKPSPLLERLADAGRRLTA